LALLDTTKIARDKKIASLGSNSEDNMSVDLNKEERTSKELEKKVAEQENRLAETLVELDKAHSNNVDSQKQAEELKKQKAMVENQLKELDSLKAQINQEGNQLEQQRKEWQAHIKSNKCNNKSTSTKTGWTI